MKRILTLIAIVAGIFHLRAQDVTPLTPGALKTWEIGTRLKVTLPESFTDGVPFAIKLDFLEAPAEPQRLSVAFSYLGDKGKFMPKLPSKISVPTDEGKKFRTISAAGQVELEVAIADAPADLNAAVLTLFLSPDGNWKGRTLQAILPIKPARAIDEKVYAKALEGALKQDGRAPDNEAGVDEYIPRTEYFTQRKDNPQARGWKVVPQALPPLGLIIAAPGQERPPYGIYSWVSEYQKAAPEIAKMGIKSLRLSGPWDKADEAMKLAAQNGVEVLFTLKAGGGQTDYKKKRNEFSSEEAFIGAFKANVAAFVKRYGPGGEFEKSSGVKSPLAVVEMWNEPNFFYLIDDLPVRKETEPLREALYPKVLKAGYETSKSIAPNLLVAGFAAGGAESADLRFFKNVFNSNPDMGNFFDILTTHPYNKGAPPEGERVRNWGSYSIANNLAKIRVDMGTASQKPIWYTELGWHFAGKHGGQFETPRERIQDVIPPDLHAAYVVRMYSWAMRLGIPRVHIMHLHDADAFNGGFLGRDLSWRPVAHAVKAMIERLPNPKLTSAISDGANNNYIYVFRADQADLVSNYVVMAWNTLGPEIVEIPIKGKAAVIYDMVGNKKTIPSVSGKINIEVGPYPIYITE